MGTTIKAVPAFSFRNKLNTISLTTRKVMLAAAIVLSALAIVGVAVDNMFITVASASAALMLIVADEAQKGGDA